MDDKSGGDATQRIIDRLIVERDEALKKVARLEFDVAMWEASESRALKSADINLETMTAQRDRWRQQARAWKRCAKGWRRDATIQLRHILTGK